MLGSNPKTTYILGMKNLINRSSGSKLQ